MKYPRGFVVFRGHFFRCRKLVIVVCMQISLMHIKKQRRAHLVICKIQTHVWRLAKKSRRQRHRSVYSSGERASELVASGANFLWCKQRAHIHIYTYSQTQQPANAKQPSKHKREAGSLFHFHNYAKYANTRPHNMPNTMYKHAGTRRRCCRSLSLCCLPNPNAVYPGESQRNSAARPSESECLKANSALHGCERARERESMCVCVYLKRKHAKLATARNTSHQHKGGSFCPRADRRRGGNQLVYHMHRESITLALLSCAH
jgi:hypothetical protein